MTTRPLRCVAALALLVLDGCVRAGFAPAAPDAAPDDGGTWPLDGAQDGGAVVDGAPSGDASLAFASEWLHGISSPDEVQKPLVAIDPVSGNIVVAANFEGSVDFGDGQRLTSAGKEDILLATYDAAGTLLWAKRFGDASRQEARALAVDARGRIVLAGEFGGSVDFGGGDLVGGGGGGIFIASYAADRTHLWSKRFGVDVLTERVDALAVDVAGNAYLAGAPNRGHDFGGGPLPTGNDEDIFLVAFDEGGVHIWSKTFGGAGREHVDELVIDKSRGHILLAGAFDNTLDLGGGALVSAGGDDLFLARLDTAGSHRWSKRFGSVSNDRLRGLAADPDGNATIVGTYIETVDFGGGPLPVVGFDTFLASFDAAGVHRWSRRLVSADTSPSLAVATDASGDVYVTGDFRGSANLGGPQLDSVGSTDAFLVSYTPSGTHRFSLGIGSLLRAEGTSLATFGDDRLIVTGTFRGTLEVGNHTLTNREGQDAFLLSLEP